MDESVLRQFLKAGYVFNRHLFPTDAGTPQGGIISPILANMTLDGIEKLLADKYHKKKPRVVNKIVVVLQITKLIFPDMQICDKKLHHELPYVLPHPFGVILLRYASAVTPGCKALRTIWRNLKD